MRKPLVLAAAVVALVVAFGFTAAEAQTKKSAAKLPPLWGKVGLTATQKESIAKIQEEFTPKISQAKATVKALQTEERSQMAKVLTPAQQQQLVQLMTAQAGVGQPAKSDEK
jgi:Spy/CpxP family protein refolding chaperone